MTQLWTKEVPTQCGPVRGFIQNGMRQFLGIPYARAQVGGLRWKPPQPHAGWTKPLDAFEFGPSCAQNARLHGISAPSGSEDGLSLNVFSPVDTEARKLPVMVWIHGGGLFGGTSAGHDPSLLVKLGRTVFVSINYRLNLFGFFAHSALVDEGGPCANYGIMDQQFALRWIQDNIEAFGGDPGCVTIFGESGGATAVLALLVSPLSAGLFHRAIVQSSNIWSRSLITLENAKRVAEAFCKEADCEQSASALRALPVNQILSINRAGPRFQEIAGKYSVAVIRDGYVIPEQIHDALATGRFNRMPVMRGTNRDEFSWFVGLEELSTGRVLAAEDYIMRLRGLFGTRDRKSVV